MVLLLQAALGLGVDGWRGCIIFDRMALPQGIDRLEIRGLEICDVRVDLTINRGRGGAALERVDTRGGEVEIIVRHSGGRAGFETTAKSGESR